MARRVSTRVTLVLIGAATLQACGSEPDTNVRAQDTYTSLDECGAIMTTRRIRHLPVMDEKGLYGLVSIGDLLAMRVSEQEDTIKYLNDYMFQTR